MPLGFITASVPFNPTQISGITCTLWLDGADSANIQVSGTAVTQWNDKSGNAGHATQTNSGNRPTFTGSGVVFNAASSQCLNMNTTFASTHSLYIVATPTSATGVYLFGRTYPSGHPSFIINYTGTALEYYAGGDGTTRTTLASPTSTFVAGYVRTFGTGVVARYNGTNIPIGGAPTTENSSIAWGSLGCSAPAYGNFYTGTIYELIIYNTTLSTIQCQKIESYLTQKWGLVGSLPSNHPGIISRIYPSVVKQTISPQLYYTAFNPTQIAGCVLWLDAADSTTITGTSPVTAWKDKSVNNYTLTYTGSPTYRKTATLSLGCITFNGTTSFNSGTDSMYWSGFSLTQPFTVFTVATKRLSSNSSYSFVLEPSTSSGSVILFTVLQLAIYAGSANQYTNPIISFSVNTTHLYSAVFNSSSSLLAYDGTATSSLNPGTNSWPGLYLGRDWGGVYDSGDYGEILFYNSALNTTERQQVESYLAQKWGLTSSLPASHLNATQPAGKPVAATQTVIKAGTG
jgi:hypothetical protein